MKKLRKIAGGDTYTIIYLKMMLLSVKSEGKIYFEGLEDSFAEELALELDEDAENVSVVLKFLEKYKMIAQGGTDEYLLPEAVMAIGSETKGAERVRRFRENKKALQCNTGVTDVKRLCNTDIDIEKEIEIDKEKDKDTARACEATLTDDQCTTAALNTVNPMTSKAKKQGAKKIQYAEFVAMTNDEYQSLIANERLGSENAVKRCIEILDNYKGSSGKKYASDYRAILNWVITRYEEECSKQVAKETKASGTGSLVQMIKDGVVNGADKENAEKSGSTEGNIAGIMSQIPRV
jgi:phage replisome organizer, putative, N-terminal region